MIHRPIPITYRITIAGDGNWVILFLFLGFHSIDVCCIHYSNSHIDLISPLLILLHESSLCSLDKSLCLWMHGVLCLMSSACCLIHLCVLLHNLVAFYVSFPALNLHASQYPWSWYPGLCLLHHLKSSIFDAMYSLNMNFRNAMCAFISVHALAHAYNNPSINVHIMTLKHPFQ